MLYLFAVNLTLVRSERGLRGVLFIRSILEEELFRLVVYRLREIDRS